MNDDKALEHIKEVFESGDKDRIRKLFCTFFNAIRDSGFIETALNDPYIYRSAITLKLQENIIARILEIDDINSTFESIQSSDPVDKIGLDKTGN